jgi:protein-tyrosine-phosphatase
MRVLIVCDGNTCRSPTLQLLLRHLASRLGRKDEFISAGREPGARGGYPMPRPGQNALKAAAACLDQKLGLHPMNDEDRNLSKILDAARTHKSRNLDDPSLRGPFDELVFIAGKSITEPVQELLKSKRELERLSVPDSDRWYLVRQGDGAFFALQRAKQCGVKDPDQDPEVIEAYAKQAESLAHEALKYYSLPLGR